MAGFKTLDDLAPAGKRVLLRLDLNVPMSEGRVTDMTRIERALPTIRRLSEAGAKVILLSHFGRPKGRDPKLSLKPLVEPLSRTLGHPVAFAEDCVGAEAERVVSSLGDGEVALLENLRFHAGEEKNDPAFIDALAALGELYVNDAFSAAHRAHASTEGLAHRLPAAAGLLMEAELEALERALLRPERPLAAIVGGAKVSTKLELLGNLVEKVQLLVIGGGMANTFLHALGLPVGRSLAEKEMAGEVERILARAKAADCDILLPTDVMVAGHLAPNVAYEVVKVRDVPGDKMILDVGPDTAELIVERLSDCRTLVWNGPLGAFETQPFDSGTNRVALAVADLTRNERLVSVAGGGDTVAALAQAGALDGLSYVSTAGGAFLEWLEGKPLPGVEALRQEG